MSVGVVDGWPPSLSMKEGSHKKVQQVRKFQNGPPYLSAKKVRWTVRRRTLSSPPSSARTSSILLDAPLSKSHQILHAPVYRGMAALGTFLYQGLPALGPFLDQGLSALGTTSDLGLAALGPKMYLGQPALGPFLDQGLAALSTTSDFRAGSPEYNK